MSKKPDQAAERVAVVNEVVTLDAWREIVAMAVDLAKAGDAAARDWLTARLASAGTDEMVRRMNADFTDDAE